MIVKEYAKSHEGRPLYAIFISSPENLSKLDEIKFIEDGFGSQRFDLMYNDFVLYTHEVPYPITADSVPDLTKKSRRD